EIAGAASTISQIFGNFQTIRSIDTTGVAAADDVSGLKNVTREDVVQENMLTSPEVLLQKANSKNGHVQVPGVFSLPEIL
ncbi:MAG TPA: Asp-tRNA(Asn)/Glu-tRNA(Gln) amidotransferase subunit GatC, partial [Candidatus Andersenbacteria bacterium]|nr:Asp-tRNA(Asn)/Glu-tRNA(Gln) amidotransferase subunit GatC [Candidatus Andersenbacteria bacterium]